MFPTKRYSTSVSNLKGHGRHKKKVHLVSWMLKSVFSVFFPVILQGLILDTPVIQLISCRCLTYAREASETSPTAVDASAESSEICWAPLRPSLLDGSWPQTFLPYHATWDENTGEGRFRKNEGIAKWDMLIMLNDDVCMGALDPLGKNERCSQAGIFGVAPKNHNLRSKKTRLQDGPIADHWIHHQAGPHQNPVLEILAEGAILSALWFHLQVINQLAALAVQVEEDQKDQVGPSQAGKSSHETLKHPEYDRISRI